MNTTYQNKQVSHTVLLFFIQNEEFAVNVEYVQAILEVPKLTRLTGAPDYIYGIINHRNEVLLVVDSNYKLNYTQSHITHDSCLLVLELKNNNKGYKICLLVDSVTEVNQVLSQNILPSPDRILAGCKNLCQGVIEKNNHLVQLINPNHLLNQNELVNLSSIVY